MRTLLPVLLTLGCLACSSGSGPGSSPVAGRIVLGQPEDPAVAALLTRLEPGVERQGRQWVVGGHRLRMDGVLLVAVLDDPDRPGERVTLGVASDPLRLETARGQLGAGTRPMLELWRLGERVLSARLSASGALLPASLRANELGAGSLGGEHAGVRYLRDPELEQDFVHDYIDRVLAAVDRAGWAGVEVPRPLSLVARQQLAPHEPLARFDAPSRTLFAAVTGAGDDGGRALLQALLRSTLGEPAEPWVAEVAALAATGALLGQDLAVWTESGPPSPERDLADRARRWRQLVEAGEAGAARAMWLAPPSLEWEWPRFADRRGTFEAPWLDAALMRAHVAVRPGPERGNPWGAGDLTLEGDAALLVELWRARAAGRQVALEVVLLASPSGTFDGGRILARPEDWREHFEHRARAVRGVGHLAFAGGVDLLVVGSGAPLTLATRWLDEEPEPPNLEAIRLARIEGWAGVFGAARQSFPGPLALMAEVGPHAERVGVWDGVDVMLLRLGPPPPLDRRSRVARLTNLLAETGGFATEVGRPWLAVAEDFDGEARETLRAVAESPAPGLAGILIR